MEVMESTDGMTITIPRSQVQGRLIRTLEAYLIVHALKKYEGNQRKAAAFLGMPKSTLHDRLENYGLREWVKIRFRENHQANGHFKKGAGRSAAADARQQLGSELKTVLNNRPMETLGTVDGGQ